MTPLQQHAVLFLAALVALAAAVKAARWAWLPSSHLPRHRVRHLRWRLRLRLHPGRGHATLAELWLRWGRFAAFRHSGRTRSGTLTWWQRARAAAAAYSVMVGRGHYRHGLRIGLDEHVLVMAPPRTGKTGWLARVILHYPGPVISTTTKHDVYEYTSGVRARRGPVHVFNPQHIGGVPSTFAWNPVDGCQHPATAIRRADGFAHAVSQKGVEEASFWSSKASDYLRACFCAAALVGGDMRLVARWAGGDASEAVAILLDHGHPQWAAMLAELGSEAQKTVATVKMTMSRALAFLADPDLAAAVLPAPSAGLDIGQFLADRGTLYLIAESTGEDAPLAPLFACLANEIHHTAALTGSQAPGGRLDPPLLMALDEVTQICPVPLPHWLADSGGKGIQIIAVVHGEAQLRGRWGKDGARVILDTTGTKAFLPGITDPDTLTMASKLCGTAALRERGADEQSRHDIMTPEMVRQQPGGHALVVRTGLAPVCASLRMVWKDRLYKQARRRGQALARLQLAAAERWPATVAGQQPALPPVPAPGAARETAPAPGPAAEPEPVHVPSDIEAQFPWTTR